MTSDRRQFIQLASALAAARPAPARLAASPEAGAGHAGSLTRMIFLDDLAALLVRSPEPAAPLVRAALAQPHVLLAGAGIAAPDPGPASAPAAVEKASEASRVVFPFAASLLPAGEQKRLHRDARLLRELAGRYGQSSESVSERDAVSLFEALSRRVLIAIHTYIPDEGGVEGWMERLIRLHDSMHAYWAQLAAAYQQSHVSADEFYDASDPILRLTVESAPLNPAEVRRVLASRPKSAYGRALADARARLIAS
jgi:hypothetical protein